jgi:hypothetical protein
VPSIIASFDVCIIPFKLNSLTVATNPVKIYEFLAVGRPVVATKLPELAGMDSLDVLCASTTSEFIHCVEHSLNISDQVDRVRLRREWAKENDWSKRVEAIIEVISSI